MKVKDPLKIAAVQFEMKQNDKSANLEKMCAFIDRAADARCDMVCFPEICLTGYNYLFELSRSQLLRIAEDAQRGESVSSIREKARERSIVVAFGLLEKTRQGKLFNTYVVVTPEEGNVFQHRKIHAFENSAISQGDSLDVFDLFGWKIGVLICYDNNLPENPRVLCLKGADLIIAPHQTGGFDIQSRGMGRIPLKLWKNRDRDPGTLQNELEGPKGRQWLMKWLPARAYDNNLFYVFTNGVGIDGPEVRTGGAAILDPEGIVIAETNQAGDDFVEATISKSARLKTVCSGHIKARRPRLYGKIVEPIAEVDTRTARNELSGHTIK